MAEVLVVVEASQAFGVKKVTLEMLTIARGLGEVSAAMPRRSASMCGITWTRPSVDSAPHRIRSAPSVRSAAASTFDVATAHEPCRASSLT